MPRRRNISAFCSSNRSLFVRTRELSFGATLSIQMYKRPDSRYTIWFRGSGCGGSWMYARGTEGGVVKPSEATFALTFATPCAVSPPARVARGWQGATKHGHTLSTYGIEHAWNPSQQMKPAQREWLPVLENSSTKHGNNPKCEY